MKGKCNTLLSIFYFRGSSRTVKYFSLISSHSFPFERTDQRGQNKSQAALWHEVRLMDGEREA